MITQSIYGLYFPIIHGYTMLEKKLKNSQFPKIYAPIALIHKGDVRIAIEEEACF